jgi:hypothetical protein
MGGPPSSQHAIQRQRDAALRAARSPACTSRTPSAAISTTEGFDMQVAFPDQHIRQCGLATPCIFYMHAHSDAAASCVDDIRCG